jgi:hypothetical protein
MCAEDVGESRGMRSLGVGLAGAVVSLVAVACGSTPANTPPATAPPVTPSPTASGPSGPPSAQVSITGDSSIAGAMTIDTIECSFPAVAGEEIFVTGSPAASSATSIHLTVTASAVAVVADTGAGTSFHVRTFSGSGVSGFDAATGAKLSGSVTETTPSADNPAGVGHITSLSATISCAGQTPGSTTMVMSGSVTAGSVSGGITDVHVVCMTNEAETLGIVQVGGSPAFTAIFSLAGKYTVDLAPASAPVSFFVSTAAATSTPTATGTTVNGDATEQVSGGAIAHTIHVSGTSTCGSGITP